jgi:hypothetical protein
MYEHHILNDLHLQEWLASFVDEQLIRENVSSVSGAELFETLRPNATATQSGTGVRKGDRDFLTKCQESLAWICGKRAKPTSGPLTETGKYLSARGIPSKLTFLRVPLHIWMRVSERYDVIISGDNFWEWVRDNNIPIVLTEGEKKAGCLLTLGFAGISVPGIWNARRVTSRDSAGKCDGEKLHEDLLEFDTPGREITIAFDYRAGNYFQSVEFKAASATAKCLQNAIAKIAILPGPEKAVDDFVGAGGDVGAVIDAAKSVRELRAESLWNCYRGFSPDRTTNTRFFDAEVPQSGTITAIKSGLGTGKTEYLKNKVANEKTGTQINLTYRNSLGLQLAEKLGSYHLDAHEGYRQFLNPDARLTLCVDSLLKIPVERLENCDLIIDESASVIKHLLCSRTLLINRLEILDCFELACQKANRIILTDGHQADWVVNYISKLAGNKAVIKIENQFKGDTPPVFFIESANAKTKKLAEWYSKTIRSAECPAIAIDSIDQSEALAQLLYESHGNGILLNSKTVAEPWAKEMLKNPDDYIRQTKPKWFIYTPTAESGVDISIQHYFSDVFGWFVGVLCVDAVIQMLRRVRHPGRITVYCATRGLAAKDGDATYYKQIISNIENRVLTEGLSLSDADLSIAAKEAIIKQAESPHFEAYCKIKAKENLERQDLRNYVFKALLIGGYQVQKISGDELDSTEHFNAKQGCRDLAAKQIFEAPEITLAEAEAIERQYLASWEERCQTYKVRLLQKLPGIEKTELWCWEFVRRVRFEERFLLSQLEADFLFKNQDHAEYLQKRKWKAELKSFLPDLSDRWLKLRAMAGLNFEQFLDPEKSWTADSPEVSAIIKLCKKKAIANILGFPGKSPMKFINKLLATIGCKLTGKRIRSGEKLGRTYQVGADSYPTNWAELSEFTALRMAEKIASLKRAELLASQGLEFVPDGQINKQISAPCGTIETATKPQPEPSGRMGWVSRWGKWVRASFLAATDGSYYRMLIEQVDGWTETLAPSDMIRWDV